MKTDLSTLSAAPTKRSFPRALYADIPSACRRYNGVQKPFPTRRHPAFFRLRRCGSWHHTDHNGGRVITAGITLIPLPPHCPRTNMRVRMISQGFDGCFEADLSVLSR